MVPGIEGKYPLTASLITLHSCLQILKRLFVAGVCKLHCLIMGGEHARLSEEIPGLKSLRGVHMSIGHKPAWVVGTDGQNHQTKITVFTPRLFEIISSAKSRIADKIDGPPRCLKNIGRPKCAVPVKGPCVPTNDAWAQNGESTGGKQRPDRPSPLPAPPPQELPL